MSGSETPKLSEVLGALVSSLASARAASDVEAIRTAHRYRDHELLAGMPVPRMRFRSVTVSLPVILKAHVAGAAARAATPSAIRDAVASALEHELAALGRTARQVIDLDVTSDAERAHAESLLKLAESSEEWGLVDKFGKRFHENLDVAWVDLSVEEGGEPPSDASIRIAVGEVAETDLAALLKETAFQYLQKSKTEDQIVNADAARTKAEDLSRAPEILRFIASVRDCAENHAVKESTTAPDFEVAIDTESIKNAGGGPDAVTRLSIVLHEDGLEWIKEISPEGEEKTKLLPE